MIKYPPCRAGQVLTDFGFEAALPHSNQPGGAAQLGDVSISLHMLGLRLNHKFLGIV